MNDKNGNPLVQIENMGRSGSQVIFFPITCKDLDAAFRYIDYVNMPEGMTLALYGIEGQTFAHNAARQPRFNADLLACKHNGDASWEDILREVGGMDYISSRLWYAKLKTVSSRRIGSARTA
ncbi:MAG: hypothetical protein LBJ41_07025 [Treponema sp.]|jgi:putative aldouronate transport system substrate-binding protein|nr:hypothetical protein [Treponema sp.]